MLSPGFKDKPLSRMEVDCACTTGGNGNHAHSLFRPQRKSPAFAGPKDENLRRAPFCFPVYNFKTEPAASRLSLSTPAPSQTRCSAGRSSSLFPLFEAGEIQTPESQSPGNPLFAEFGQVSGGRRRAGALHTQCLPINNETGARGLLILAPLPHH